MIKCILLYLLLISATGTALAKNVMYIAVNNSECTNCLNQIANLNKLDSSFKKVLVFPKKYQKDSTYVLQRLYLENFTQDIVWSDSLYRLLRNNEGYESTVSLYNNESGKILKTLLVDLPKNLIFFNSQAKKRDTLVFSESAFGPETQFEKKDGYFYFFDGLKKEMRVFDCMDMGYQYTLSLTDSMIKAGFKLKFGKNWKKEWEMAKAYCKRTHKIDANIYSNYFCSGDTTWMLGAHTYVFDGALMGKKEDTLSTIFLTLSTYKGNQLVDFSLVENYIGPEFKTPYRGISRKYLGKGFENAYYILTGEFLVYNHCPYFAIMDAVSPDNKNHFLMKYKKHDHTFVFDTLYDRNLPDIYLKKYGYNNLFTNPISFSSPYLALYGSDHLFSLNNRITDKAINYFTNDSLLSMQKGIWDIKISSQYVYMIIMDYEIKKYCYLKYDIQHKKPVIYKSLCDYKSPEFITTPKIDDFDYNYTLLPISDNSILRISMPN